MKEFILVDKYKGRAIVSVDNIVSINDVYDRNEKFIHSEIILERDIGHVSLMSTESAFSISRLLIK